MKEKKRGFKNFLKKDKKETDFINFETNSLISNERISDEKDDLEDKKGFFLKNKNNSQNGDLTDLINKLQSQKTSGEFIRSDIKKDIKKEESDSKKIIKYPETFEEITEFEPIADTELNITDAELNIVDAELKNNEQNELRKDLKNKEISQSAISKSDLSNILSRIKKTENIEDKLENPENMFSYKNGINHNDQYNQYNKSTEDIENGENIENTESGSDLKRILGRIKNAEKRKDNIPEILVIPDKNNQTDNIEIPWKDEILKSKEDNLEISKEKINEEKNADEQIIQTRRTDSTNSSDNQAEEPDDSSQFESSITFEKSKELDEANDQNGQNEKDRQSNVSATNKSEQDLPEVTFSESERENESSNEKYSVKKYNAKKTQWSQPEKEEDDTLESTDDPEINTNQTKSSYPAKKTIWSDGDLEIDEKQAGVKSVNEIDNSYSGLILPEGATFEIEEFRAKTLKDGIDSEDHELILSKINKIYSEYFPPIDLEQLNKLDLTEITEKKPKEKKGIFKKTKTDKSEKIEYNPSVHGPVVDLTFNEAEGVEEVDLYPVNEPYAYVRIVFDKNTNEYIYKVLEPVLNPAEKKFYREIEQRLFETLDVNTKELTKEKAGEILKDSVDEIILDYGIKLNPAEKAKLVYHIHREFLGDGLIDAVMHDKYIEDISCDGLNTPIFVFHSNYESLQTNLLYKDTTGLDSFVTKLAQKAGKYISIAEPMLDATMSDGSRIQMTLGTEVTAHGSTFTIRKFKDEPITPTDLTEWGTFSPLSIAYIWLAVEAGKSCIFAGGTASGKTTSLNAISLFIPPLAKIVTLEDTRELKLPHLNWIPSVTRESFDKDGKGSIDMYELLRAALRQRPEYILVGEVRGAEAQTLFQAMSTGHVTYATMHADSVASAVHRIENPPLNVPRNMLSSLNLMSVQVQARIGGQRIRRNKQLIEILDIDPRTKELITNEVFKWHQSTDEIRYSGKSYILEDIMESRGWDETRMVEELKRRQEILEWMRIKKLRNYKDVGKVLMSYYRDSEAVIKLVREDLYE